MKTPLAFLTAFALAGAAFGQTQGVTKNEILIGTIQDLSGPVAAYGKHYRQGMLLRVEELNEQQGGINGRKLKVLVEDNGYDPKKALLATQKLVNQDKVFAIVGHIGTAMNNVSLPVQIEKNVINFFPLTAAREMYVPVHKLKFSGGSSYYDQVRTSLPALAKQKNAKKLCAFYQDDDFGQEVLHGAEDGAKAAGMTLAEKTTFKRGATDFSSQVARLKAANCDIVVLGTIIRETIGTIGEGRKTGYNPAWLGTSAAYTDLIHKLGGKAVEGFYAAHSVQHPYMDEASQPMRFWAQKYVTKYGEEPSVFSVYGYTSTDAFITAATKAGPNLTTESFIKAMESLTLPPDIFGSAELKFSSTRHYGTEQSRLSQIVDGRWKVVSDWRK